MLALAGGCPPADRRPDGIDVLPVLAGEEPPFDRTLLFWRKRDQRGILGERAVRSGRWKYIWWPDGLQELYDLSTDVAEQRNLAATQPALARELHLNLDSWERDLVPPLYDQNPDQLPNLPAASGNEKSKNAGGHLGISPKTP
jgi:arylsulfatase A-like enzyme